jgi:hypothetical protein
MRENPMRRGQARDFWCEVVSEAVSIRLKRSVGLSQPSAYFVQCNQVDCQYVDANKLPCPLHVGMFDDEIKAADAVRAARLSGDSD